MAGRRGRTTASSTMAVALLFLTVCCSLSGGLISVAAFPHSRGGGRVRASLTELQRHVEFFDKNKDGIITLTESTLGFTEIGFPAPFAAASAAATHAAFGPLTTPFGKIPSTNIYISHITRAIHGSDSGAYNKNGGFVPEMFEKIFKHAHTKKDALNWLEIRELLVSNRDILNPVSWPPAEVEWELAFQLARDDDGYLHKDTLRGIYDGSTFYKFANESRIALPSDA